MVPIPTAIVRKLHIACRDNYVVNKFRLQEALYGLLRFLNVDFAYTNNSDTDYEVMTAYIVWHLDCQSKSIFQYTITAHWGNERFLPPGLRPVTPLPAHL